MNTSEAGVWSLGEIPFHIGACHVPTNAPLPDLLPMRLSVDSDAGAVVQVADPAVESALERAYVRGSQIGTPLSEAGFGKPALDDFLAFAVEARAVPLESAYVLEVGCGTGALLRRIVSEGAHAVGIEPGQGAAEHARAAGLEVIAEPFDPAKLSGRRFDLIVHHAVLEHVSRPGEFLAQQLELLTDGGLVVCSVPDCRMPLANGDISMLVHEHVSYFTPETLARLAASVGGETVAARASSAAGSIYCALRPSRKEQADPPRGASIDEFAGAARATLGTLRHYCEQLASDNRTLGVYCPSRFINYHALIGAELPQIRYFDDDPLLEGRYYPPVDVQIEARPGLLQRPVDEVLVVSWTFGERIAESLRSETELGSTPIRTVADVLAPGA
jgi:2-polyprenyl-3-methyl-5-hydroxy-6-metoxy-1,4-benzoquinol methylase